MKVEKDKNILIAEKQREDGPCIFGVRGLPVWSEMQSGSQLFENKAAKEDAAPPFCPSPSLSV